MAIQMRRGNHNDLDITKLVQGEFAVCTDGYIVLKVNGSQVVQIATAETLQQAVEACEQYMENATYVYFMYSANPDGTGMTPQPNENTKYIGVYNGNSSTRPTDKTVYTWVEFSLDVSGDIDLNIVDGHLIATIQE